MSIIDTTSGIGNFIVSSIMRGPLSSLRRRKMMREWSGGKEIVTRCCSCQKILNAAGAWQDLEESPEQSNKIVFSHSVCPACLVILYPELVSPAALISKKKKRAAMPRP